MRILKNILIMTAVLLLIIAVSIISSTKTHSQEPNTTLQQLSICMSEKSDIIQQKMEDKCSEDEYMCMYAVLVTECNIIDN